MTPIGVEVELGGKKKGLEQFQWKYERKEGVLYSLQLFCEILNGSHFLSVRVLYTYSVCFCVCVCWEGAVGGRGGVHSRG